MAKDFLGQEIKVGDAVVCCEVGYKNLIKVIVYSITSQKFKLCYKIKQNRFVKFHYFYQSHNQVVRVPNELA